MSHRQPASKVTTIETIVGLLEEEVDSMHHYCSHEIVGEHGLLFMGQIEVNFRCPAADRLSLLSWHKFGPMSRRLGRKSTRGSSTTTLHTSTQHVHPRKNLFSMHMHKEVRPS